MGRFLLYILTLQSIIGQQHMVLERGDTIAPERVSTLYKGYTHNDDTPILLLHRGKKRRYVGQIFFQLELPCLGYFSAQISRLFQILQTGTARLKQASKINTVLLWPPLQHMLVE
jgi:hypothetical protein